MRCPNCGEEVRVGETTWECEWCGDSGMVQRVSTDEPETNAVTVTISVTEDDESEPEEESVPEESAEPPLDPERAKRMLAAGDFPEDEDICREVLVGAYPDEIEDYDESGDSPCWNILYDIFECDPDKAIEMWRYLLDIAGDLLKTDPETAEELLPDWDLFDPPDEYAIGPLFDALSDVRFAEQVFGSAYVGSLQPDILRVCFDNGAEKLGRRCLAIALANPYLSERRAESLKQISDEFAVELPETATGKGSDDGTVFHYCSVVVSVSARPYAYFTGGLPLKAGDIVEVPFGNRNAIRRGEVVEVMDCTREDAPWPPEGTKTVLRVVSAEPVYEPAAVNRVGKTATARTDPAAPPRVEPTRTEPEPRSRETHREELPEPRVFEKTNTRKEFPYGKLIAGILIADVIAIIALIFVNRSGWRDWGDAAVPKGTSAVVTTAEILNEPEESTVDPDETSYVSEDTTENPEDLLKPIGQPGSLPPLKLSGSHGSSGSSGGSWSVRDEYDSPEDFWEDNMDEFDDEEEAFDYWYDG